MLITEQWNLTITSWLFHLILSPLNLHEFCLLAWVGASFLSICPDQAEEFITRAVSEANHFVFLIHALWV